MFSRSVQEIISKRVSTRTYAKDRPADPRTLEALLMFCSNLGPSPFGDKAKFQIIDPAEVNSLGMIKNAASFIVGAIAHNERCYESYGFLFEHVLLKATELGLSTCWLGYFELSRTVLEATAKDDMAVPAISPVGYASNSPFTKDTLIRTVFNFSRRRPFPELFYAGDFSTPIHEATAGEYAVPLAMVQRAPSAGNKQPWRIVIDRDFAHFYIDLSQVPEHYRKRNLHLLDIGIAIAHFELTCHERNIRGHYVSVKPELRPSAPESFAYSISWKGN